MRWLYSPLLWCHMILLGLKLGRGLAGWKTPLTARTYAHTDILCARMQPTECEQGGEIFFQTQPHWGSKGEIECLFVFVVCNLLVFPFQPATSLVPRPVINCLSFPWDAIALVPRFWSPENPTCPTSARAIIAPQNSSLAQPTTRPTSVRIDHCYCCRRVRR